MKVSALACLLFILASGCMVGPDFKRPEPPMPDSFLGVKEAKQPNAKSVATDRSANLALWWRQFDARC